MKTARTFLIIALFSLMYVSAIPDIYRSYSSRKDEPLEEIAVRVYSELPNSESDPEDNRYRGILIFKENRDAVDWTVKAGDSDQRPSLYVGKGETLKIPIYEEGYPSIPELQAMIAAEIAAFKKNKRISNEAVALKKISNEITSEIETVVLTMDQTGEPRLKEALFERVPYVLTDGTILPQSPPHELDRYVRRIIESNQARKTIFLFPENYADHSVSYRELGIMHELALANKEKHLFIVLESIDDNQDNDTIGALYALRNPERDYAFFDILTRSSAHRFNAANQRPAMKPSMALFYQLPSAEIMGLEDRQGLQSYFGAGVKEVNVRTDSEFEEYEAQIANHCRSYYALQADLFLRKLEDSIVGAVKRNNLSDNNRIKNINDLQLEFARLFVNQGARTFFEGVEDERQKAIIFSSIDELCGAETLSLYLNFKKEFKLKIEEEKHLLGKLENLQKKWRDSLVAALELELVKKRSEKISDVFSSLPDGSVGVVELTADGIDDQMAWALRKRDYNLVVYSNPLQVENHKPATRPPDPAEHEKLMKENIVPADFYKGLFIPSDFKGRYETDWRARSLIHQIYALSKSGGCHYENRLKDEQEIVINSKNVEDLGCILRVAWLDEKKKIAVKHLFIPGTTARERSLYIEEMVRTEKLGELDVKVLLKFAKVLESSKDL